MQSLYPGIIRNARGLGTLCAVDFKNVDVRNAFVALLRNKGIFLVTGMELYLKLILKYIFFANIILFMLILKLRYPAI